MKSHRWFLYGPFALAAIVLVVWWGVWREGAKVMRAEMANFAVVQQANGAAVSHGPLRTKGFPFYLRGVFTDFDYDAPRAGFSYSADQVFVDALPYALDRLIFSSWGAQRLVISGETFTVEESNLKASIGENAERGWFFKAESDEIRLRNDRASGIIKLQKLILNAAPSTDVTEKTEISAVVNEPQFLRGDKAVKLDNVNFFGVVDDLGVIEIRLLEIEYADASMSVEGTLALDAAGFLSGQLDGAFENPVDLAKWLASAASLPPEQAQALQGAAALLAFNGNKARVELVGGKAYLAGVEIGPAPRF